MIVYINIFRHPDTCLKTNLYIVIAYLFIHSLSRMQMIWFINSIDFFLPHHSGIHINVTEILLDRSLDNHIIKICLKPNHKIFCETQPWNPKSMISLKNKCLNLKYSWKLTIYMFSVNLLCGWKIPDLILYLNLQPQNLHQQLPSKFCKRKFPSYVLFQNKHIFKETIL